MVALHWQVLSAIRLVTFVAAYLNAGIPLVMLVHSVNALHFLTMKFLKFDLVAYLKFKEFW